MPSLQTYEMSHESGPNPAPTRDRLKFSPCHTDDAPSLPTWWCGLTSASATSQMRCCHRLWLLQQICIANDYFNYSSRLEAGREWALIYLATSSAQSSTGRDQSD
jgi:hypothetical protein